MQRILVTLGATVALVACSGDDGGSAGKKGKDGRQSSSTSWSSTTRPQNGQGQNGQGQDGQGQNGQGQNGQGQSGQATDGTATLVLVNDSEWMAFDLVLLVVCDTAGSMYSDFWVDDWLDPGEDWTLTGVPTDTCFQVEAWDTFGDFGVSWPGRTYTSGEHVLSIVD